MSYPFNDSIQRAISIGSDGLSVPYNFSIDSINEPNADGSLWFYVNFNGVSPQVRFTDDCGIDTLSVYGAFEVDFNSAVASILYSNVAPSTIIQGNGIYQGTNVTMPSQQEGLFILRYKPHMETGVLKISILGNSGQNLRNDLVRNPPQQCMDCVNSTLPLPGRYLVSAWVRRPNNQQGSNGFYTGISIKVNIETQGTAHYTIDTPSTPIIDGWMQIEGEFVLPTDYSYMELELSCDQGLAYFDDVRLTPINSSMKSYVYDFKTFRLMAELDERNFATLYEYDEEGHLKRIKKETERGVMTIQETTTSIVKR
jgi:hypothetical protein